MKVVSDWQMPAGDVAYGVCIGPLRSSDRDANQLNRFEGGPSTAGTHDLWLRRLQNPVLGRIWVPKAFDFSLWDLTWNLDKFSLTADHLPPSFFERARTARREVIYLPHVPHHVINSYVRSIERTGLEWTLGARDIELVLDRSKQYPYFGSPSAHRRQRLAALEKRARAGTETKLLESVEPNDVPQLMDCIRTLEANSWKSRSNYAATARFKRDGFLRFVVTAAELGLLRSSTLYVEDVPIALHLGLIGGGEYSFWYSVFSERYRQQSPGILLLLRVFTALPDEIGTFSFLRGDEDYKHALGPRTIDLFDVAFARQGEHSHRTHWRLARARSLRPAVASLVRSGRHLYSRAG